MKRWMVAALLMAASGCGRAIPAAPSVLWKDAAGKSWQAPLRTPPPSDPIWTDHPGAGVVLVCARTGEEVLVADPEAWLAQRNLPGAGFRSKHGAPLILPTEELRRVSTTRRQKRPR